MYWVVGVRLLILNLSVCWFLYGFFNHRITICILNVILIVGNNNMIGVAVTMVIPTTHEKSYIDLQNESYFLHK